MLASKQCSLKLQTRRINWKYDEKNLEHHSDDTYTPELSHNQIIKHQNVVHVNVSRFHVDITNSVEKNGINYFISAFDILFDKTLGNEPIPRPLDWDELEKINDVESGMAYFRQNEKLLQTTINNIIQNEPKRLKAIQKYIRCKNKQQHEESFSLFLKVPDYSTLKDCFIKQVKILERQKSNSKNEVCKPLKSFPEQDMQALNQLISKKYDILWRWNKALFNYEFASKNYQHTISLLQRIYNDL
ncbi:unnamed protein product [Schistosoma mattheei]|uniref:Uncharacterized protein n=1 Tax=Schistosoma mattheei TaxID=31246 RepID=A0AA85C293_9TREM|nr:unnamed protein product [Schistosoma mattheei]